MCSRTWLVDASFDKLPLSERERVLDGTPPTCSDGEACRKAIPKMFRSARSHLNCGAGGPESWEDLLQG